MAARMAEWDDHRVPSPVIEISGLVKTHRGRSVLRGIDLRVDAGESVAVLGPDGAGKSTAVEICAGFRRPDHGEVRVLGAQPARAGREWRARVGYVAQRSDDLADLTVNEAITTIGSYFPRARPAAELIDAAGLSAVRSVRCGRLPRVQRRRLDVALGLVGRPELVLLDEPTIGFEEEARREFWSLLRELRHDGSTIVLTTRYVDEAEYLGDRIAVLAAGQIVDVGPPATLGGRGDAGVTVRWFGPHGERARQTTEPTRFISELSAQFAGEIPGLVVERPSLRDVYSRMIEQASLR